MPANKSSSSPKPLSTKPNPNARSSETNDPVRRSFTGNPFSKPSSVVTNYRGVFNTKTPVNSPSDFARQSYEDKENSKDLDLKSARVRSPVSASKGTKNFMAPTISAASKFNTTSPRKKILVDRNEPPRSSLSSSESESQVIESVDLKSGVGLSRKKTVSFADAILMLREEDGTCLNTEMDSKSNQVMKIKASHDSTISDMGHKEALESDSVFYSEVLSDTSKDTGSFADAIIMSREEDDVFLKTEMDSKSNQMMKIEASHDSTISDMGLKEGLESDSVFYSEVLLDTGSLPEEAVSEENDCAILDPTFKISSGFTCSTPSDVLVAPQYRDSTKPYDPVTNFLVPRPQFRLYKPNPRVQHILNRRKAGKPDYSSDSEVSSEDSQKEAENVSSGEVTSKDSQKEPKNVSLGEIVEKEEKELIVFSQPKGASSKPKLFFTRLTMFVAFLLVILSFTSLSISLSDPPVTDLSLSKLYVSPEITQFAKMKLEGLAQSFQLWSENTFVYIWKLISNLTEVHKLAPVSKLPPVQYINLTALLEEDHLADGGYQLLGHNDAFRNQENVLVAPTKRYVETEQFKECHQDVEAEEEDIEEVVEEDNSPGFKVQVHQSVVEDQTEPESELITPNNSEAEQAQEVDSSDFHSDIKTLTEKPMVISEVTEIQPEPKVSEVGESEVLGDVSSAKIESTKAEDQTEAESEAITLDNSETELAQEIDSSNIQSDIKPLTEQPMVFSEVTGIHPEPKVSEVGESEVQGDVNSFAETESSKGEYVFQNSELDASVKDGPQSSATMDNAQNGSEDNFLAKNAVAISLIVVLLSSLLAVTAFTYAKRGKPSTADATTPVVDQPVLTKKFDYSPSEMSSFRSCSYDSKQGLKDSNEAQSKERKVRKNYKRESLASSDISMSSASYGSFTTYEKISSKHHGYADEDTLITPVRRSSRIKKQVTSP